MTQPLEVPVILLTNHVPHINWLNKQPRCWEVDKGDGNHILAAVSDELIPTREESMELPETTLNGPRNIRGMVFRDLLRKVDGISNRTGKP
jgi:hypothetical protein